MTAKDRRGDFSRILTAAGVVLPLLAIGAVLSGVPLGEPGVWVWDRIPQWFFDPFSWCILLLWFGLGAAAAWRADTRAGGRRMLFASAILLTGFLADYAILTGGRAGLAENALAVLNPFTTGYLQPDRTRESITSGLVSGELAVRAGEVPHHRHVHPPGNIYLAELAKRLPGDWGGALLPDARRELETLRRNDGLIAPLDTPEMIEAALKLTVLFLLALEIGKLLLAWMLWQMPGVSEKGTALLAVAFGSNAAVLFLGHYDTFYFLLSALVLTLTMRAVRRPLWAVPAGIMTGAGGVFTLGFGAIGGLAAGAFALGRRRWQRLGLFAAGGLAVAAGLYLMRIDIFRIFLKCWENQRLFQAMSGRSYGVWALLNVLDALLFCGVLPCLAILLPPGKGRMTWKIGLIALFFWFFILFSGGARGEFGRLAIVYLPVLLFALGIHFGRPSPPRQRIWRFAAIGMMLMQTAILRETLKLVLID